MNETEKKILETIKEKANIQKIKVNGEGKGVKYYTLNMKDTMSLYKMCGIDEDTFKSHENATKSLTNVSLKFATDALIKEIQEDSSVDKVNFKYKTKFGSFGVNVSSRMRKGRNPKTNETMEIPVSIVSISQHKSYMDKELVHECKDKIIEELNK